MAYTSVIPVRRLDRTVDYVQNKEKTTPKSLEEAVDYAANRDKTESACFETGLGCTTTSAFEDMRLNTLRWHKETGVQGYHLVQSFAEGEVTPELAHQIGVEFAEQLLHPSEFCLHVAGISGNYHLDNCIPSTAGTFLPPVSNTGRCAMTCPAMRNQLCH